VHRRCTTELGDIPLESIFYGLKRGTGKKNKISLCMVINIDIINGMEGSERHTVFFGDKQTMFGSEIH
jgi:hypothetical protein